MTKWERINNENSHSHLSYSHFCPIPISLSNLVSTPMGIPREGWESSYSIPMHISTIVTANLYAISQIECYLTN